MFDTRNFCLIAGFALVAGFASPTLAAENEIVLHTFLGGDDGEFPYGGLVTDGSNLYGTTFGQLGTGETPDKHCGKSCGNIYGMAQDGNDFQAEYSFMGSGTDGSFPTGEVLLQSTYIWGTTEYGPHNGCGGLGCGTVFRFEPSTGKIKTFGLCRQADCGDGAFPRAGLIAENPDGSGALFGTTSAGGQGTGWLCGSPAGGCGVVYQIPDDKSGPQVIYSFCKAQKSSCKDGAVPLDRLLVLNGSLFGTTAFGGNKYAAGVIFELTQTAGKWDEQVLYTFCGDLQKKICADGAVPEVGLTADAAGNLYGATTFGGIDDCPGFAGCGVVFKLSPPYDASDYTVLSVFHGGDASGSDSQRGSFPQSQLAIDDAGNLFGTTSRGGSGTKCKSHGASGCGTVFTVAPDGTPQVLYDFLGDEGGSNPAGALVLANGSIYGVTRNKGDLGKGHCLCGVVYQLSSAGAKSARTFGPGAP